MSAPWVTYRPEIKVLDCTVRDGGLVNDHMFDDGLVKAVYEAFPPGSSEQASAWLHPWAGPSSPTPVE